MYICSNAIEGDSRDAVELETRQNFRLDRGGNLVNITSIKRRAINVDGAKKFFNASRGFFVSSQENLFLPEEGTSPLSATFRGGIDQ